MSFKVPFAKEKLGKREVRIWRRKKEIFVCIQVKYSWDILY